MRSKAKVHSRMDTVSHMEKIQRSMLGIGGLVLERIEYIPRPSGNQEHLGHYVIHARLDDQEPIGCVKCGAIDFGFTKRKQMLNGRDTPLHGIPCLIKIYGHYYCCSNCNGVSSFKEHVLDRRRRMTKRLVRYVEDRVLVRPSADIERDTGLSKSTISSIRDELIEAIEKSWILEVPSVLGIDDIKIAGSVRTIFTDSLSGKVIAMADSKTKEDVGRVIKKLAENGNVKFVTMDLDQAYRRIVATYLPHAQIVYDKFHIFQLINKSMDKVRVKWETKEKHVESDDSKYKTQRIKLNIGERLSFRSRKSRISCDKNELFDNLKMPDIPFLRDFYMKKEELMETFDQGSSKDGISAFIAWERGLPDWFDYMKESYGSELAIFSHQQITKLSEMISASIGNYLLDQSSTINRFYGCIDEKLSNSKTERANYSIRRLSGYGLGYKYETLKDRILYSHILPSRDLLECDQCNSRFLRRPDFEHLWLSYNWDDKQGEDTSVSIYFCSENCFEDRIGNMAEAEGPTPMPEFHTVRSNPRRSRRVMAASKNALLR